MDTSIPPRCMQPFEPYQSTICPLESSPLADLFAKALEVIETAQAENTAAENAAPENIRERTRTNDALISAHGETVAAAWKAAHAIANLHTAQQVAIAIADLV